MLLVYVERVFKQQKWLPLFINNKRTKHFVDRIYKNE